ncbi:MAG: undecaprenyl/decaprenyl-phosphate alpha-N-acetylglucosaminyl 1-phosphate transferase [Cyclobacteriaceae bacterium]|nr:undecaprenyl/decaprenyl-phosphate alpha-N-acetylglucosaminyl 1-phosphate transferase [Cyclobacteriaceae bacterium HetDA_MAG_MS6]
MPLVVISIAFLVTFFLMPLIIRVFTAINLLDAPDRRKIHKTSTPSLGGIAIFTGIILSLFIVLPFSELANYKFLLAGMILLFILGVRDDISSLQARHKLVIQGLSAFLVVQYAGIRLEGLYGLFGVEELPMYLSIGLSIFIIMAMSNAFNLIDGIDGLAGSIGILASGFLGLWFYSSGHETLAIISLSITSAVLAFLFFNWYPSKIFMGDTGSIFIGFMLTVLLYSFINISSAGTGDGFVVISSPVAVATSLLIVPIYDTLRVFILRLLSGGHPFVPDKRHIHHVLLKQGFDHAQATLLLVALNLAIMVGTLALQEFGNSLLLIGQLSMAIVFGITFDTRLRFRIKNAKQISQREFTISKSA